jgi:hypothetical protein
MTEPKKLKIIFEPGCLDNLDITQEELDALVAEIQEMVDDGSLFENSILFEDLPEEEQADFQKLFDDADKPKKYLH